MMYASKYSVGLRMELKKPHWKSESCDDGSSSSVASVPSG
jgi:hypothetical protein